MLKICEDKLIFRFSRSSGPGGQNVNKVNTKVQVLYDIAASDDFTEAEKQIILKKLAKRIDADGFVNVTCQRYRTQIANRTTAIEKLEQLIGWALVKPKMRRKTKIPYSAKIKRLEEKKKRSQTKKLRIQKHFEE